MSYNINRWKTKKLEGLRIPLKALSGDDFEWPDYELVEGMSETFCGYAEFSELNGVVQGDFLEITSIDCWGSSSGHFYSDVLFPVLEQSKGTLVATIVWEDGDILRLTVQDGVVTGENVEI